MSFCVSRVYQELVAITGKLDVARAKAVPKKRFAFSKRRSKAPARGTAPAKPEEGVANPEPEPRPELEPTRQSDPERFDPAYLIIEKTVNTACIAAASALTVICIVALL